MADTSASGLNPPSRDILKTSLGFMFLAGAGIFMASISWLKWPDLLVDFGEQIYVAWQLSEGKVLYKDMAYLYGPFSGYLHALVFKLFGPGILTLALFNIFITTGLSFIIYFLIKNSSDQLTAIFCTLAFLTLFAFGQYSGGSNFNFICSYVYELPHGVALSLLTLYLFSKYVGRPTLPKLAAVFISLGLVFLTKPEVFLAIAIAIPVGTALSFHFQSLDKTLWVRNILVCLGSFLVPSFLFFLYLSAHLPAGQALSYIISPWTYVQNPSNILLPLYQWVLGFNAIGANLIKLLTYILLWTAIIGSLTIINRYLNKTKYSSRAISVSLILLLSALLNLLIKYFHLLELGRPLPPFLLILGIYYLNSMFRKKGSDKIGLLIQFTFTLFSFVLLFKIILNAHIYHYGFALALPGTLVFIRWALYEYPSYKKIFPGPSQFYRNTIKIFCLIIIANHIWLNYQIQQAKTYPVGSGRDILLDYSPELEPRGPIVSSALKYIQDNIEPGEGIATLPFGNMINYMTRHANPLRAHTFNPVEADIYGEERYLEEIKMISPKYILILDIDSSILGARYLGQDYAKDIYRWMQENYILQKQFGEFPSSGRGFGILILKRNDEHSN